jgi:uncharacterized RmlC-like cupin family protein
MRIIIALSATILFATSAAYAQEAAPVRLLPADLVWTEIVPGVEFAAAEGDWTAGAHKKYVRLAGGTELPVHTHSAGVHMVVLSGEFTHSYPDDEAAEAFTAGTFIFVPGGAAHANSCRSAEPCVVFTVYDGAFDLDVPSGQ